MNGFGWCFTERRLKIDPAASSSKRIVLVGGGHTHALVLRDFALHPAAGAVVTLISDTDRAPYSGMVPGYVAGVYGFDDVHIDLRRLCAAAGASFVLASVTSLDLANRTVTIGPGSSVPYDILSLNVGIRPSVDGVPGAARIAVKTKPVSELLAAVDGLATERIVVVGTGAGGVELALALRARLGPAASITIIGGDAEILASHAPAVQRLLRRELDAKGIVVRTGAAARKVEGGVVTLEGGVSVAFDRLFWATQAAAPSWLRTTGLALTPDGFVRVAATLASTSHPDVFAAGDVATIDGLSLPKSGVYAVREGKPLAVNLRRRLAGRLLTAYVPQPRALALIGTGDGAAVASWGRMAWRGRWLWRLKDRIDRRFMRQFGESLARSTGG